MTERDRHRTGRGSAAGRLLVLLASAGVLAACSAPPSTIGPANDALTIVSLNPCLDAILVEVAQPGQLLALSHYSRDPGSSSIPTATAARFAVTGGTAEEVIALAPDLVLASTFLPAATRSALERAGLTIAAFGSPTTTAASIAQVREVAALVGGDARGEALAVAMTRAAAPDPASRPISTLLWQPGQIVPGEATLVAELLRAKGFANHAAAMGLGQADYAALETVLADPPEVLLVAGSSAGQGHPLLAGLPETRTEALAPNLLFCGGPTVIALADRLDAVRAGLPR